jgi:pimeloyl-ACP methyl ester carboxylesterase
MTTQSSFRHRRSAAIATSLLLSGAALGITTARAESDESVGNGPFPGASVGSVDPLQWAPCPDLPEGSPPLECATYPVPLDYREPDGETIDLAVSRLPAKDQANKIGSLFLNPGGPGGSGVELVTVFGSAATPLNDRFDLVGFDPRGTGASGQLACWDASTYAAQFPLADLTPDEESVTTALRQGREFSKACRAEYGDTLGLYGTGYVARDMDLLRAAAGDEQLSYLGFSYGTFLGNVYADLYPSRVRTMVLDGALDPREFGGEFADLSRSGLRAAEKTLTRLFDWCASAGEACTFGAGDPAGAFTALLDRLEAEPIEATADDGTTILVDGYTVLFQVWVNLGSGRDQWAAIMSGLQELDTSGTGSFVDEAAALTDVLASSNTVIECTDSVITKRELRNLVADVAGLAPTFAPILTGAPSYDESNVAACATWKTEKPSRHTGSFRAEGSAPILVVSGTNDPSTPYEGAVELANTLDNSALLTFVGEGHTTYGRTPCITDQVNAYLIDGTVPAAGAQCIEEVAPTP